MHLHCSTDTCYVCSEGVNVISIYNESKVRVYMCVYGVNISSKSVV